ncbi:hypothetical protein KHA80_07980 [Anaerobacillus sp. HL2]|nr:hypothetical protein KHA80_07980 [Anaerobacillus sp. HL2]
MTGKLQQLTEAFDKVEVMQAESNTQQVAAATEEPACSNGKKSPQLLPT